MDEKIVRALKQREHPANVKKLFDLVIKLVKESRQVMSKKYEQWDRNNDIYRGIRPPDEEDKKANRHKEPEKMVVPLSYAQIQTFIAFVYLLFTQGRYFLSLNPTGDEDHPLRNSSELTLERDLRRQRWPTVLYQLLLDISRFGIAITKTHWEKETVFTPSVSSDPGTIDLNYSEKDATIERIKYEGNKVRSVSPYRWFPDIRKPLTDWAEGQFCADEHEWSLDRLKQEERKGNVAGIDHIEPMSKVGLEGRRGSRLPGIAEDLRKHGKSKNLVVLTETQIRLVPSEHGLGPEKFDVMFLVWTVNDDRIVRIDRMGYAHQEFTYDMSQMSPDMQQQINEGLADVIFDIQNVISWLINSRILSVRRGIDGKLVADGNSFDIDSFQNSESPVIFLKKSAPKLGGIQSHFAQLDYVDSTQGHFQDATFMTGLAQQVTGINENAMGQFTGGRRSATEARAVNAGAAGRMKLQASMIFWDHINPMGRKMLSNQRQGMSFETFKKILGTGPTIDEDWAKFHPADSGELVGTEDFFVFDITLESEKGFIAQSLQELLQAMMASPEIAQAWNINPKALLDEIMELRGVGKLDRFSNENAGVTDQPNNDLLQPNPNGTERNIQSPAPVQRI